MQVEVFCVSGANPGFHEGVADILSLAVGTAEYFQVRSSSPSNMRHRHSIQKFQRVFVFPVA